MSARNGSRRERGAKGYDGGWQAVVWRPRLATAVVLPWAIEVERREPGFLLQSWVHNTFGPIVKASLEGHGAPPGYYLLLIWPMFLPWSLFLPVAVLKGWSNRRLPPVRFALAAVIGPWVLIELVKQKLPHYLFPLFPALAFLTADLLVRFMRGHIRTARPYLRGGLACWATIAALSGSSRSRPMWSVASPELPWVAMWLLGSGMTLYAATIVVLFRKRNVAGAATLMGLASPLPPSVCTHAFFRGLILCGFRLAAQIRLSLTAQPIPAPTLSRWSLSQKAGTSWDTRNHR